MKPFYWQGTKNFGDYLNSWLWPRLLPECLSEDTNVRLIGVGSLLKASLNLLEGRKIIFGTGSGYGAIPRPEYYRNWEFYFVRGPLTAKCFRLPPEKSIIDGAWLLGLLPEFKDFQSAKRGVSFIPHWTSSETGDWARPCSMAGLEYLDPQGDLEEILKRIASSELVITESLHGAIMADLFRTPWVPVRVSPKFVSFKWLDWFQSVELEGEMRSLPLSDLFDYFYHCVSPRKVNYEATPAPLRPCILKEEQAEPKVAGKLYRFQTRAKRRFRAFRRNALSACKWIRGAYPVSSWNDRHHVDLARCLENTAKGRTFLSSEILHSRKLDQLNSITEELRSKWRLEKQ